MHSQTASFSFVIATLSLITVLLTGCASSNTEPPTEDGISEELRQMRLIMAEIHETTGPYQEAHNLLGEVLALRSLARKYESDSDAALAFSQAAATAESFLGNAAEAHRYFGLPYPREEPGETDASPLDGLTAQDAVTALARAATGRRAVFINEAHHVAQHRLLTLALLPRLREQGFTHFAAETLSEDITELTARGYPTRETGYYTQEPFLGDVVRVALALGYELVAYESEASGPAQREPGQARNLYERIFRDHPQARALVHVGYGHNSEDPTAFGGAGAMAVHFKDMTGIDPLTVDQTRMTEKAHPSHEHALFRHVNDNLGISVPTVFANDDGGLWSPPEKSRDVTVFHPRTRLEKGRPDWMRLGGARGEVRLEDDVCATAPVCVVEARWESEGNDAVPIDRVEVRAGEPPPVLLLPTGAFRVHALDAEMEVLKTWTVKN